MTSGWRDLNPGMSRKRGRVMNKLFLISVGIAFGFAAMNYAASSDLRKVQSGELTLICHMRDGVRVIEPGKVVDFSDGVWFFERGHAKNCIVKPAE